MDLRLPFSAYDAFANYPTTCLKCDAAITNSADLDYCSNCKKKEVVSCILPNKLYMSDYHTSKNYELLKSHGIKQILTIGIELPPHKTDDFASMHIYMDDAPYEPISNYFEMAHEFINKAPTLVHCYAGISRSASLVISYLIKFEKMTVSAALMHCRQIRPKVSPNPGFLKQLIKYRVMLDRLDLLNDRTDL